MAIFALLPILGYALFLFVQYNRKISISIFLSITFIISFLYIFGLLNLLAVGGYSIFYAGILLLGYLLYARKLKALSAIKSVPFIIFISSCAIYLYLFRNAHYAFWDEYSHWGIYIKEMMYSHRLHDAESVSAHLRYPPGPAIWQYFIALNTGYSEASTYFATFVLLMGSTLMLYEYITFKQAHWILAVLIIQVLIFANFGHGFNSIYVDHVIGSMFTGILLCFIVQRHDNETIWMLAFPLVSIVLLKDVGLYFAVTSVGLFFILELVYKFNSTGSLINGIRQNKKIYLILLSLLLLNIAVHISWNIRQDILDVPKEKQTVSGIVKGLVEGETVLSTENKNTVRERFWRVFFNQQIHKNKISQIYNEFTYGIMNEFNSPIKFTTFTIILFALFMFTIIALFYKPPKIKVQVAIIGSSLIAVILFYFIILYHSYMVAFDDKGALSIQSYVRYANIGVMPLMFIPLSLCLPMFHNSSLFKYDKLTKYSHKFYPTLLVLLIVLFGITRPYLKPLYAPLERSLRSEVEIATNSILERIPEDAKLFIVFSENGDDLLRYMLKFILIPLENTISKYDFLTQDDKTILNAYAQFNYIWFPILDDTVIAKNWHILQGNNQRHIYGLYKVISDQKQLRFEPVE